MSKSETLAPNFPKLDRALRSIGYSFEVAVADILDNSIDAGAKNVAIRIFARPDGQLDLAMWDDGSGMTSETLKEAMRFGADVSKEIDRLGKFGLGLKLASLSQARDLKVVTFKSAKYSARAWLEKGISKGFSSTIYDAEEARDLAEELFPDRPMSRSGTIVLLSRLYRISAQIEPELRAQKLVQRLQSHLSLAFHRFLSGRGKKLQITVDIADGDSGTIGIPIEIEALDPFDYPQSGSEEFPAEMKLEKPYQTSMKITAHVWPPNSMDPEYKLPGGANARQGFYFYRNSRLIQAGGWNGLREAEPHSSLARLAIDVAPSFDMAVSLDVKKVEIQLPPELAAAIQRSRTSSGTDFKKYLSIADKAYRKRQVTESELPLIPATGLPSDLVSFLKSELKHKSTTRHQRLDIVWKTLVKTKFFDIDRDGGRLLLNKAYRTRVLHGLPASSADAPVLKCLLFFALEDALTSERMSSRVRDRVDLINRIVLKAVKHERVE